MEVVSFDNSGSTFQAPVTKPIPKLYVICNGGAVVYVGITNQPIRNRLRYGQNPDGTTGYHGYKWMDVDGRYDLWSWVAGDTSGFEGAQMEAIEAETVFRLRALTGQWPEGQTEIHFHTSNRDERNAAAHIVDSVLSAYGEVANEPDDSVDQVIDRYRSLLQQIRPYVTNEQPLSAEQRRLAELLGYDLAGCPVWLAHSILHEHVEDYFREGAPATPSQKQVSFAGQFGIDISYVPYAVGSVVVNELMTHLNVKSIQSQALKAGDTVTLRFDPSRIYEISSISADGVVFFKGGNGKRAAARNVKK